MANQAGSFGLWLDEQLERRKWRASDLVRASGQKPNGRPVIDATRVGSWLKGERPGPDLLAALAEALGVGMTEVMRAAGYPVEVETRTAAPAVSHLADLIDRIMDRLHIDEHELESRAGSSRGTLSRYRSGPLRSIPTGAERGELAFILGVGQRDIDRALELDFDIPAGDLPYRDPYYRLDIEARRLADEFVDLIRRGEGRNRRSG